MTDDHQFIRKNVESIESDPFGLESIESDPFGLRKNVESIESDPFGLYGLTPLVVKRGGDRRSSVYKEKCRINRV